MKLSAWERLLMGFHFKLNLWLSQCQQWFTLPAKTPRFFLALAASLVLLLLLGGGTFAVAQAEPGDWLYPVRQQLNQAILSLTQFQEEEEEPGEPVAESPLPEAQADQELNPENLEDENEPPSF